MNDQTVGAAHWALPPIDAYATGVTHSAMLRYERDTVVASQDALLEELPVSLEFSDATGASAMVMMATPLDLEAFAIGFALTEGLIDVPSQVRTVHAVPAEYGMAVLVELTEGLRQRAESRQRNRAAGSSCGLCGLADMQAALEAPVVSASVQRFAPAAIYAALAALPAVQVLGQQTGAAHAAAFANAQGEIVLLAEDAGRHNALDKLVGMMAQQNRLHRGQALDGFCVITSRASFEMVQKAARVGFPLLAAISAPTALAARLAQQAGLTLVGFARGERLTCFAHDQRIIHASKGAQA